MRLGKQDNVRNEILTLCLLVRIPLTSDVVRPAHILRSTSGTLCGPVRVATCDGAWTVVLAVLAVAQVTVDAAVLPEHCAPYRQTTITY